MGDEATSRTIERKGRSSSRRGDPKETLRACKATGVGKLPAKGIPLPQAVGWDAFATLLATFGRMSPQVHAVLWILERVLQRRPLSATALARDLHVRRQTASTILRPENAAGTRISGWVEWARHVTGTGGVWSQVTQTPLLTELCKEFREQSGSGEYSANSLTKNVIEDSNDKNGNSI